MLIESDLFRVAGRMLAHSFLLNGPHVARLSPAVVHVLFNGDAETATVVTEYCPDLHIRDIIKLVCIIKKTCPCNFLIFFFLRGEVNLVTGMS